MSVPTIFLSATSDDLKDRRETLGKALSNAGCRVFTQEESLAADSTDGMELLRQNLDRSDFVIHVAGIAYGAEPEQPAFPQHPDFRCSYTQFEYYYAHQQGKKVIALVCAPGFPYSPFTEKGNNSAARERRRTLQLAHRERVSKGRFTGTPLDGYPLHPVSEPIADEGELQIAFAGAIRTIREHTLGSSATAALETAEREMLQHERIACPADISRIVKYAPAELIGREAETKILVDAWDYAVREMRGRPHVLTFVAMGGEGKTSLVAKWAADQAAQDWPGCEAAFAWSFYSQGTRDQVAGSSDLFLNTALAFFGDEADQAFAATSAGAFEKGQRLARVIGARRALLILDGLEPLQYAPTSPTPGELKDQGLAALLKGLATTSQGLCIVTTRYAFPDLRAFLGKSVQEVRLTRLSTAAGVALLQSLRVRGSLLKNIASPDGRTYWNEFEKLVEDVNGHALTLNLLGSYLRDAHGGDIRRRILIKLEEADARNERRDHAVHVMDAYVHWMAPAGYQTWLRCLFSRRERESHSEGRRALALLRVMGLFDRPATPDCLTALLRAPAIAGLTGPLVGLSEAQLNFTLTRLESARLLTRQAAESATRRSTLITRYSLDSHPLLREYFGLRLRTQQPKAWRAAHRRLFQHLCTATQEGEQPTLEELQPLYQAVAHGCQAGMTEETRSMIYRDRLQRDREAYSTKKLGALGSDLGALACFFKQPWSEFLPGIAEAGQAWLLNEAAFRLRALGRLYESLEATQAALKMADKHENWNSAAIRACNLSELELTLGKVSAAVEDAGKSVIFADNGGDAFQQSINRTTHADALHQAGRRTEALARFREAEQLQAKNQPEYPLLYSVQGFQYCDLLLTDAERAAWQVVLAGSTQAPANRVSDSCHAVARRATQTLQWVTGKLGLLDVAVDHLTLGRAGLYAAILNGAPLGACQSSLEEAVSGVRRAGHQDHLPRGLLTRAWWRALTGARTGPESAQSDLDEAWEIAERGPMPLFMANVHLQRARLFFREKEYPKAWISPQHDLAKARGLILQHGYRRRLPELEDAEAALMLWTSTTPRGETSTAAVRRTVLELDLVGYSTICDSLEQGLDASSVTQLNQQIQSFIDLGLKAAGVTREKSVAATTGDGAILVFEAAADADRFAATVHAVTAEHNRTRPQPLAKRVFRSGAATGDIVIGPKDSGGFEIAGATIARAVRLEAKAQPGGFQIDEVTFQALLPTQTGRYGPKTRVAGKREEVFEAYEAQMNPGGPADAAFFTGSAGANAPRSPIRSASGLGSDERYAVLALFRKLASDQYLDLVFLIEIPIGQRPQETLSLEEKKAEILRWAEENDRLARLLDALRELTEADVSGRPK